MSKPAGKRKGKNANTIVKSVKLSENLIQEINEYAIKHGLTFGKVVRLALEKFLEK